MIQAVASPTQKLAFEAAIQGAPYFRAVMGRDLALWADNPGAPVRLFVLPGAALTLNGSTAQLCGQPQDWEELLGFLHFAGVTRLTAQQNAQLPEQESRPLFLYCMPQGKKLVQAKAPKGLKLTETPSVAKLAAQLFPQQEQQECYYSETCTALAHGYARVVALQDAAGQNVSTVGAYAMANGEAYMAMGETLPELRGQGIGGWLIPHLANELTDEGWEVTFLCGAERCHFYERLGFVQKTQYIEYKIQ